MTELRYHHTQKASMYLLILVPGLFCLAAAVMAAATAMVVAVILTAAGLLLVGLTFCFQTLTVSGFNDRLDISFGPCPLFRRAVLYTDVTSVRRARSTVIDGWGVHYIPGRGWTWNLWGFDCVELDFRNGRLLRIGSDDALALTQFLRSRCDA